MARLVLVGAPGGHCADAVSLRAWRHSRTPAKRERKYRGNLAALMLHRPSSISDLALPCM
jgi:hypothetical protein